MRVIRQSAVLGRTTHRRLLGVIAASAAAILESIAVCSWFGLIVIGTRTPTTALVGLGILVCGCVLRTGVFGAAAGTLEELLCPDHVGLAVFLAASWVSWLLVAESIGGVAGIAIAGLILTAGLTVQFALEPRIAGIRPVRDDWPSMCVPAALLAGAASVLLSAVWFVDWSVTLTSAEFGSGAVVVELAAIHLAGVAFVFVAFVAHRCRFRRTVP